MHHVNSGLIRPYTEGPDSNHGICGLSYALKENSKTAGLRCDLFISHAWDEGGPSPNFFDTGIWWFPKMGVPKNGWFIRDNPIEMDDLGVPLL